MAEIALADGSKTRRWRYRPVRQTLMPRVSVALPTALDRHGFRKKPPDWLRLLGSRCGCA